MVDMCSHFLEGDCQFSVQSALSLSDSAEYRESVPDGL